MTLNAATGILSGTPTTAGAYAFTVTATDSATPANTGSAAYTLSVNAAPVTFAFSPASGTLPGGTVGMASSQTLSTSGGTAPYSYAVTAGSLPAGLTLNAATGIISGTPTTAGTYAFTVTATDSATPANTGSAAYAMTIAPAPVTFAFSPASGTLPAGTVGTASSQALSASGGTAPYSYAVTAGSLPAGLTLNAATGIISGTPTTPGTYAFTVTATDSAAPANTGSAAYAMTVNPAPVQTSFAFSPAGGALQNAMVAEDYRQSISATGGQGALLYSLQSGNLPKGITLNISTGELTGPLASDAVPGRYDFTIGVRDGQGATGAASYTLTVDDRAVTVTDKVVNVPAGDSPPDVYLNRGATGGPFVDAQATFVEPPNAGTATIIRGQLAQAGPAAAPVGWYLQFSPNPAYTGQVRIGFRLTSDLGASNTGTVIYNLNYDPAKLAADINDKVHDFVRTRQDMISSTIHVPAFSSGGRCWRRGNR